MLPAIACVPDTKFTTETNEKEDTSNPQIIFKLDNKNPQEYKILYSFNIEAVVYIKSKIDPDKTLDSWINKITLLFPRILGIRDLPDVDSSNFTEFYNQIMIYPTEDEFHLVKRNIKTQLEIENLTRFANLDKLDVEVFNNDYSTKNYDLFRKYRKIFKSTAIENIDCFEHRNIISLGDGEFSIENGDVLSNGTAFQLANNLIETKHKIDITAADIIYPEKLYLSHNNIDVTFINLDNQKSFVAQGLSKKFDLVIMHKSLCMCGKNSDIQTSCAGILMNSPGHLKKLLFNLAEIIDTDKKYSTAILTGSNNIEMEYWEDEVQQFNIENKDNLVAEIARNKIGTFKGIIIQLAS